MGETPGGVMKGILVSIISLFLAAGFAFSYTMDYYGLKITGDVKFCQSVVRAFQVIQTLDTVGLNGDEGYSLFGIIANSGLKAIDSFSPDSYPEVTGGKLYDKRVIGLSDNKAKIYLLDDANVYNQYDAIIFHEVAHIYVAERFPNLTEIQQEARVREVVIIYERFKSLAEEAGYTFE